ncbi:hypothetical protein [Desulfonatronum thiodismutans]|uniref:hypothetical protein n=1 Tax=Desulfonatronum thiodismutans TaxID=159290 RepID=UPI0004ABD560|nr:hypothetical protein [Desulfonatronum thiodismutans]
MNASSDDRNEAHSPLIVRDQRLITSCAMDIIAAVERTRGIPLQPRDRMALKLLTPKNSALLVREKQRHLGCRQISFDIKTDDLGLGSHQLVPSGVHVLNREGVWWSDIYGIGRFLWNLYSGENPQAGMMRVLERLFKFEISGLFGPRANFSVREKTGTIEGNVLPDLRLYIHRREGSVETSLRKLIKARAIFRPKDLGLQFDGSENGRIALLFGKSKRYAVSFTMQKI